jgi:hypothetical protein
MHGYSLPAQAPLERAAYVPQQSAPAMFGDVNAARRAALWLALLIPWLGLPIGWAFIMTADPRKQEIGRFCVLWSSISMVAQTLIMFALTVPALNVLAHLVPSIPRPGAGAGGLGGLGGLGGQQ